MMKKSVLVLIFNSKGEIALQLRSATDNKYPSCWDFSGGGGVEEGEDIKTGAMRELYEEIGIKSEIEFVMETIYNNPVMDTNGIEVREALYLFKGLSEGPFNPDPKEVSEVKFFNLAEINEMIEKDPAKFHPEFVFLLKNYPDIFVY